MSDGNGDAIPQPAAPQTPAYITQEHLNAAIGGLRTSFKKDLEGLTSSSPQETVDPNRIKQLVEEGVNARLSELGQKVKENQEKQEAEKVVTNYLNNLKKVSREDYPDFEEVMSILPDEQIPSAVKLLADEDDAGVLMYHYKKNPSKLIALNALAASSPKAAKVELKRVRDSIVSNKQKPKIPPEPPKQHKPTIERGGGTSPVSELRKNPLYRG